MPIYEFKCGACGQEFEKLCGVGKDKGIACPKCGGRKSQRRFSVFGVRSTGRATAASGAKSSCGTCSSRSCSTCK